jgi:uncharacterized protein (TIGR00299 family) protein
MKERVLYYDCFSGICGDMNLAAMVDLGVPPETLRAELSKLGLDGWALRFAPDAKKGIHGTRADVDLLLTPAGPTTFAPSPRASGGHGHRSYRDIRALIEGSSLSEPIKGKALAIFGKLAEAEAKVHAESVDDVLFHEVGAVDSIVDIVGAAICLDYLKPDKVLASRVELGGGFVQCRHGLIPVPAPAVVELLRGAPVRSGAVEAETTTPTGAAILAAFVDEWTDDKRFTIRKTAYGVGHRDSDIPNLLRVFLGERERVERGTAAVLLECNIDDMSPEIHGHLFDRLLTAGADDVWLTPIVMKKSRSAVLLSVLCGEESEDALAELILRETTTLGLRRSLKEKTALERETRLVPTSLGEISVKTAFLGGKAIRAKPEYEDLRRIAVEKGIPLIEVYSTVAREIG